MRTKNLAAEVDLTTSANGDPVLLSANSHPFLPNYTSVVVLSSVDLADSELKLQGSNDGGANWADLKDTNGDGVLIDAAGIQFFEVVLPEQIRTVVTADDGGTPAGEGRADLIGN